MTASLEELTSPEFVHENILIGEESSQWNRTVLEVLQIRRIVEEMRNAQDRAEEAKRVIRLTWTNAILTLMIAIATAVGVTWSIAQSLGEVRHQISSGF